ncbi:MAG: isoaspartyl peptidase/L-asparaginase [Planctomycetota bacterium]|nr:isoaspartyl peptidase/L-asparaginase [Planctomycetota bacterium]
MRAFILANGEIKDTILAEGAAALRAGASAADVAERVARAVEDDPDDRTVGYGGLPNLLGEVELDASFMDGATRRAGAVCALRGFRHPIAVARAVAERLPHVLLAGAGACEFAARVGAERREMLSPEARRQWRARLAAVARSLRLEDLAALAEGAAPDGELRAALGAPGFDLIAFANQAFRLKEGTDTMNVLVRDRDGHLVTAVSTSGIAWKYPGRVGDSPVLGAGNYADDRYGAAACMGLGELAIRTCAAYQAVAALRGGATLEEAGRQVAADLAGLSLPGRWVRVLVLDKDGRAGGFATEAGKTFKTQYADEPAPRTVECVTVAG